MRVIGIGHECLPVTDCVFIESYDPYASDADESIKIGGGVVRFTKYIDHALTFNTEQDADEYRTRQHPTRAIRQDGAPNRPLTAFTIVSQPKSNFIVETDGTSTCNRRIIHLTA